MQFTGMQTRSKKDVYEGDIVVEKTCFLIMGAIEIINNLCLSKACLNAFNIAIRSQPSL